jgi:hypothetical protein
MNQREAIVLRLTEPALRLVIRDFSLRVVPVSPLMPLQQAAKTLDALSAEARRELTELKMVKDGRTNWFLASAIKVLGHPEEVLAITERAALGTRIRRFWGANDLFVEHVANHGLHELGFFWTRAQIMGETAVRLSIAQAGCEGAAAGGPAVPPAPGMAPFGGDTAEGSGR